MSRALWLADALRAEGVRVIEQPGWRKRGSATFNPRGVVCHHTAGAAKGDAPSLRICINGRSDVPGPLCQVVLGRSGTAYIVASGRANHAGRGRWRGLTGNSSVLGIEAENTGVGQPWPSVQVEAYVRICAAMCRRIGVRSDMVCGHKEWAPGRKIDPNGIGMADFRRRVEARLAGSPAPQPKPQPAPRPEEFTVDNEARARFDKIEKQLGQIMAGVMVDEASDQKGYASLRGWVVSIGKKLGVSGADAKKAAEESPTL